MFAERTKLDNEVEMSCDVWDIRKIYIMAWKGQQVNTS